MYNETKFADVKLASLSFLMLWDYNEWIGIR